VDAWEGLIVLADLYKWHFLMHSGFSTKVVSVRHLPRYFTPSCGKSYSS